MRVKAYSLAGIALFVAFSASAREGQIMHDTLACRDKKVLMGLGDVMGRTDGPGFNTYVANLKTSGQCMKVEGGRAVTFSPESGGACLSLKAGEPCYFTTTIPRAIPETTGAASR
jgi:hypothetical protein